jgi:fibronectin-binding autotransporter adhesin
MEGSEPSRREKPESTSKSTTKVAEARVGRTFPLQLRTHSQRCVRADKTVGMMQIQANLLSGFHRARSSSRSNILIFIATFAVLMTSHAGTHVWSGAQDGYWSNPANWSSGGAPSTGEAAPVIIQFPSGATARRETTNNVFNLKVNVLAFYGGNYAMHSTVSGFTLIGGPPPFPYGGNLVAGASTNTLIDDSVLCVLTGSNTFLVGTNATLLFGGKLSGSGGFTKTGSGTLKLYNSIWDNGEANDYQGITTVLDGTLWLRKVTACGWSSDCGMRAVPNSLIVGDGTATHSAKVLIDYIGQIGTNCHLTINAGGRVEMKEKTKVLSLTLDGGQFVFTPQYIWDEVSGMSYPYYSDLTCGTNITSYGNRFGNSAILGWGTIRFEPASNSSPAFLNVVSGSLPCQADIRGNMTLHKIGEGEFLLQDGQLQFPGNLIVDRGVLAIDGYVSLAEPYSLTVSNGAQISLRGAYVVSARTHLNGFGIGGTNGAIVVEHDGASMESFVHLDSDTAIVVTNAADTIKIQKYFLVTFYPLITGTGSLTKKGRGTLEITGNQSNGMTAPFIIEQGALALNLTQDVAGVSSPLIIGTNPANGTTAEVILRNHNQIPTNVPITINDSGTLNLNGFIQTVGPLTLQGGDIKTYGGLLFLSADVRATNGLGSSISGSVHLGGARRTFHLAPGYGINFSAQLSDIGSNVGFDLDGGGTLTLSAANTALFGSINVKRGVLYARSDFALGNASGGTTVANGARLAIDGRNLGAEPLTLTGEGDGYGALSCAKTNTLTGPITLLSNTTIRVVSPTDRLIFGDSVAGAGGLVKVGTGTLVLQGGGANTYSGITTVVEGSLELNKPGKVAVPGALLIGDDESLAASHVVRVLSAGQFGGNAPVAIYSSGVLDLSDAFFAPQSIGSLTGIGLTKLGVSPLSIGGDNTDTQYGGRFTGTGAVIKQGTGTLTLGGASDQFFGVTTVNAGVLNVQNWIPSSPVTVNAGGKLMGNGLVGSVTGVGGMFSPGCCPTLMKLSLKNLALNPASTFHVHLDGTNAGQTVKSSQASVTGTVNLGGSTLLTSLGFNSVVSNKFTIIDNDGNDAVTGTFKNLTEGAKLIAGGAQFQITYHGGDGNDVVLTQIGIVTGAQVDGVQKLPDGKIQIGATGLPNTAYDIEATQNFMPPAQWINIGTATSDALGHLQFVDVNATNYPIRFYRFVLP